MTNSRLKRLREAMQGQGLDAMFVSNPKNVQYLTGFRAMMPGEVQPLGDPEGFVLVQADRCDFLCDGRYIEGARALTGVMAFEIESPTTAAVVADALGDLLGSDRRIIGFEEDAILHGDAVALFEAARGLAWRPAAELLTALRVIKTPDEVALVRQAQDITGACFQHLAGWLRPGVTERETALEIERYLKQASDGCSFDAIVAFGETACHPHYVPSPDRKLEPGHMVLLDFGAVHQGYCGDLTRMICMGKAEARLREVYAQVLAAQQCCLTGLRPGLTGHEADALCRDHFEAEGCVDAFQHGTGHGLGLAIHEEPRLKKTITTRLEPGMVFTVEPGLYYAGWGGVRIEDVVVMTATGHENLTAAPKELVEIT